MFRLAAIEYIMLDGWGAWRVQLFLLLVLLDEPTTRLDNSTKTKLIDVMTNLDLSYVVISHEFDFVDAITDNVYTMDKGKIIKDDELHMHKHKHVHTLGKQPHKHV